MSNITKRTQLFKLMIGVFVAFIAIGYGWSVSRDTPPDTASATTMQTPALSNEEQVKSLVVRLYKWKDQNLPDSDFIPISNGQRYTGIDLEKHNLRLEVLRRTGFFSNEFLVGYDSIAKAIDSKLKSGELKWELGDLPPYGGGVNPWCACQDYPSDAPWDSIEIAVGSVDDKTALLTWTWGNPEWAKGFSYSVRAVNVDNSWKISYLQGFDSAIMFKND